MLENMGSVALQVVILFVIIATGFVLTKCNVLNKERVKGLIDIVVYVVTPSNIIVSFQRELTHIQVAVRSEANIMEVF